MTGSQKIYLVFERFKVVKKNIIKIYVRIRNTKFTVYKPKLTDVLIADKRCGKEAVELFFHRYNYEYLDIRLEEINIYVLIITLIRYGYKELRINYINCSINLANPKVVFCLYENNWSLYKSPNKTYNYKLIISQLAVMYGDSWNYWYDNKNEPIKCDYFLTNSNHSEKFLSKFIQTEYLKVGSFKLNAYLANLPLQGQSGICFISEYRENSDRNVKSHCHSYRIVTDICKENNIRLSIAFASSRKDKTLRYNDEREFYRKIYDKFEYSSESSYIFSVRSNTIVCMSSNLGLELISLGYKVFFLDTHYSLGKRVNGSKKKNSSSESEISTADKPVPFKNYYSQNYGDSGEFWDSGTNYKRVSEKILKLYEMDRAEWEKTYKKYKSPVEYFDPNNKIIRKVIDNQLMLNLHIT